MQVTYIAILLQLTTCHFINSILTPQLARDILVPYSSNQLGGEVDLGMTALMSRRMVATD